MNAEFIVALHAVVFLNHKKTALSSESIAENVCTNPARVRKILSKLNKAGLTGSKSGADGGYYFKRDAASVTLRDILDALGMSVISTDWRSGGVDMDCQVASGMAVVTDELFGEVNELCRARLAEITVADVDKKLFP